MLFMVKVRNPGDQAQSGKQFQTPVQWISARPTSQVKSLGEAQYDREENKLQSLRGKVNILAN